MMLRSWLLIAAALIVGTTPALAADRFGDPYIGLRAIGSYSQFHNNNATGFTGAHERTNEEDLVAGIGGVIGYRFFRVPLRMEVEGHYRFRFDWDNRDLGPPIDYESNVDTIAVLFNAILDWRNSSAFTPYVGVSVGWARNHNDTTRTNLATRAVENVDETTNEIAYGVMLGIDWAITEDWSAGVGYRYLRLGEVGTGGFTTGDSIDVNSYESHDVLVNVNYTF